MKLARSLVRVQARRFSDAPVAQDNSTRRDKYEARLEAIDGRLQAAEGILRAIEAKVGAPQTQVVNNVQAPPPQAPSRPSLPERLWSRLTGSWSSRDAEGRETGSAPEFHLGDLGSALLALYALAATLHIRGWLNLTGLAGRVRRLLGRDKGLRAWYMRQELKVRVLVVVSASLAVFWLVGKAASVLFLSSLLARLRPLHASHPRLAEYILWSLGLGPDSLIVDPQAGV